MNKTQFAVKSAFKRVTVSFISLAMIMSFIPDNIHKAFADEVKTVSENVSDVIASYQDTDEEPAAESAPLEYQVISASPDEKEKEVVTLDGLMPSNATVNVSAVENDPNENICAYNISITDNNGDEFQPENGSTIKVDITNSSIAEADSSTLRLWHISDDGIREEIRNFKVYNDTITFQADGFSVYEVDNGTPGVRTYHFMMPDNPDNENSTYSKYYFPTSSLDDSGAFKKICKQTIKNGEHPIFPQLPAEETSRYTFVGWFVYDKTNGLADEPFDFENIPEIQPGVENVELRAVFKSCAFIIFHDQYNSKTSSFTVSATRRGVLVNGYADIDISDYQVSYDDQDPNKADGQPPQMHFTGWADLMDSPLTELSESESAGLTTEEINELKQEKVASLSGSAINEYLNNTPNITPVSSPAHISNTTRLYPVFEPIRWIEFISGDAGSGATYIPPKSFALSDGFSFSNHTPTRAGYIFQGWFTEDGTQVTDADLNLTTFSNDQMYSDGTKLYVKETAANAEGKKIVQVKLFARWTPDASQYTVIIWKQKITDNADMDIIDDRALHPEFENTKAGDEAYKEYIASMKEAGRVKSYDFEEATTISANVMTEQVVSVASNFTNKTYTGFYYLTCDPAKTVAGNGSTVLNVYYDRERMVYNFYSARSTSSNYLIVSWNGLYGQLIADNGYTWDFETAWYYYKGSSYTRTGISYLDAFDVTSASYSNHNNSTHTYTIPIYASGQNEGGKIIHVLQDLNGNYSLDNKDLVKTSRANQNNLNFNFTNKFTGFEVCGYTFNNFTPTPEYAAAVDDVKNLGSNDIYVYHRRLSYTITFRHPVTNDQYIEKTLLYQQPLADFVQPDPQDASTGFNFTGWYLNSGGNVKLDFDNSTMPDANMVVYSGYEKQWFLVTIDPNGGEIADSQSTWFWEAYDGEPISEYKTASRNYEPNVFGDHYYTLHDRAYYGLGDEWDPFEDAISDRCAKYTTDASLSTDAIRYSHAEGVYRYLGWYRILPDGSETPYNFSERVTSDVHLKLHWKQLGTYNIQYNAGIGIIDGSDSNETTFSFLDADNYSDHADVVVTRVAKDPDGMYNFVGWKIHNDSSERVYYPGQSFQFSSLYATPIPYTDPETGETETRNTIILDAVYEEIKNAAIIYDPNGGEVTPEAKDAANAGGTILSPEIPLSYTISNNQLIVSDFLNNTAVKLSNGVGFTNNDYRFIGWNTKPDGSGISFDPNSVDIRRVDTNSHPSVLYAQWEVMVYFDKNNSDSPDNDTGWGGHWEDSDYQYDTVRKQYYKAINLNSVIDCPPYTPVSNNSEQMFHYWSTEKQTEFGSETEPFNFAETKITKEFLNGANSMTLYGCWKTPIKIPVHVVDTTDKDWVLKDQWLSDPMIKINGSEVLLNSRELCDELLNPNASAGYDWELACTAGNGAEDYKSISEDTKIDSIWYDPETRQVMVTPSGSTTPRVFNEETDAVYLVYYKSPETLPIIYRKMNLEGRLVDITKRNDAPTDADVSKIAYNIHERINAPLSYTNNATNYYSFAIGVPGANSSAGMKIITDYKSNDTDRPFLQIRNTWKGFQYSIGNEWVDCGYDVNIYAIYYEKRPTIVNLSEITKGLQADMDTPFHYQVTITKNKIEKGTRNYYSHRSNQTNYNLITNDPRYPQNEPIDRIAETTVLSTQTIDLSNGDTTSYVLFYEAPSPYTPSGQNNYVLYAENGYTTSNGGIRNVSYKETIDEVSYTQTISIVQASDPLFKTVNDAVSGDKLYNAEFTSSKTSDTQTITYTNTSITAKEVKVALAHGNTITDKTDELRTADNSIYSHVFDSTGSWNISNTDVLSPESLIDNNTSYVFSGIITGSADNSGNVTVSRTGVPSVTFGSVPGGSYDFFVGSDNSDILGDDEIWFVYSQKPVIKYVFKKPDGTFETLSSIERNGSVFKRDITTENPDGTAAVSGEMLPVTYEKSLLIAQITTPTAPAFVIPGDLDYGSNYLALDLKGIGVGSTDENISDTVMAECNSMQISINEGYMQYKFSGSDTIRNMPDDPVVYVIYEIKGHELELSKTVTGDSEGKNEFTFTIQSPALDKSSYFISGFGSNETIQAVNNTITVTVQAGKSVTLYGLQNGVYTITETDSGNCTVTAMVNGINAPVTHNSAVAVINYDTKVNVVNNYPIPVTGTKSGSSPYLAVIAIISAAAAVIYITRRKEEMRHETSL